MKVPSVITPIKTNAVPICDLLSELFLTFLVLFLNRQSQSTLYHVIFISFNLSILSSYTILSPNTALQPSARPASKFMLSEYPWRIWVLIAIKAFSAHNADNRALF